MYDKYLNMNNPTKFMRSILDACVYINEIDAKLSLAEIIDRYGRQWPRQLWPIDGGNVRELGKRWQQIVEKILVKTFENVEELKKKLHEFFNQIHTVLNNRAGGDTLATSGEEMADALFQMHSSKLSHFLAIKSPTKEFMDGSNNAIFALLQQTEGTKVPKKNYQRFMDRIEAWDKYEAQRSLGKNILNKINNNHHFKMDNWSVNTMWGSAISSQADRIIGNKLCLGMRKKRSIHR
jgi:hypothetical protein